MTTIKTKEQIRTLENITIQSTGEERVFRTVAATEYPWVRTEKGKDGKLTQYIEILDISSDTGLDRERIDKGGLSFCKDHEHKDVLGKVRSFWREGDQYIAEVYISEAEPVIWTKIKEGVYNTVSLGYRQTYRKLIGKDPKSGLPIYRVGVKPTELSLTGVPVDPNSQITQVRSVEMGTEEDTVIINDEQKEAVNTEVKTESEVAVVEAAKPEVQEQEGEVTPEATTQVVEQTPEPVEAEEKRGLEVKDPSSIEVIASAPVVNQEQQVATLRAIGERFGETATAEKFIQMGRSAEELLTELTINKRGNTQMDEITNNELKRFSLGRAIKAAMSGSREGADYEIGLSQELGAQQNQLILPFKAIYGQDIGRALTVAQPEQAGDMVETVLRGDLFSALKQNNPLAIRAGVRVLPGLSSRISMPRQTAQPIASAKTENAALDESNSQYDLIDLSEHRVGVYTKMSSTLKEMNSVVTEAVVAQDLRQAINNEIDRQFFYGSGIGPNCKGLFATNGINIVEMGDNGDYLDLEAIVALETAINTNNYEGSAYLMNSKVYGKLKTTKVDAGSGIMLMQNARELNGYRAELSNVLKSDLTKGTGTNLSPLIFGDFSEAFLAFFGNGMTVQMNPYSDDILGMTRIVGSVLMDVGFRRPEAIAAIIDAKV